MDVTCRECGVVNDYRTEIRNGQNCAFCNSCESYIKNISYVKQKFYFGKFKGNLVTEVNDAPYLQWFLETTKPSPAMREAIEAQLSLIQSVNT